MSAPATRRGFLRGLTTLPLIGGGVNLIGSPTRAAQPVTLGLLATYSTWLHYERRALMHSCGFDHTRGDFVPMMNPAESFYFLRRYDPATWGVDAQERAAVVLAAVGCPLTSAQAERQWATVFRPALGREAGL